MKYIIISHGAMAHGAKESLEMIIGKQENLYSLSINYDSTIESTCQDIESVIAKYPDEQWIIFTDIVGGTPFHASYRVLSKHNLFFKAMIVTGFNLPLLIEVLVSDINNLATVKNNITNISKSVITIVDREVNNSNELSDDYDL